MINMYHLRTIWDIWKDNRQEMDMFLVKISYLVLGVIQAKFQAKDKKEKEEEKRERKSPLILPS